MEMLFKEYTISDDKSLIQAERVYELLSTTYWAEHRSKDIIKKTIENSVCFGVYKDGVQVGYARCITDYGALYYLADVIVGEEHRGIGLGKALIKFITEHEIFAPLYGVLNTKDAHGLYEQFGFQKDQESAMKKKRPE